MARPPFRSALGTAWPLALALMLAGCGGGGQPAAAASGDAAGTAAAGDAQAGEAHARILTLDPHIDIHEDFDGTPQPGGQFDLEKLEQGGLDAAVVALFASNVKADDPAAVAAARAQVDAKLAALRRFVAAHPDKLAFARSADEIESTAAAGKHAIVLGFLNAVSLGTDLALIRRYYDEGVRVFGLVHAGNNPWADSSRPSIPAGDKPDAAGGLTPLGRRAVEELNRLGVVVDVSQLTPAGVSQVLEISRVPVIASHSAPRARVDVTRNLSDDELRAIAAKGGVVHVVTFAPYLRDSAERRADYENSIFAPFGLKPGVDDPKAKLSPQDYERYQEKYREFSSRGWKYASLDDYLDAVDYTVRLIGIDHVGLSSDFNHGGGVDGYSHVGEAANVTAALLERGYSEEDVAKLWSGNFLRVLRQAEQGAVR